MTDDQNETARSAHIDERVNHDPRSELPGHRNRERERPEGGLARSAIDPDEFLRFLEHAAGRSDGEPQSLRSWIELAEAWQITAVLRRCRGNRSATARALGIGRRTLYAKMDKLGIIATWGV